MPVSQRQCSRREPIVRPLLFFLPTARGYRTFANSGWGQFLKGLEGDPAIHSAIELHVVGIALVGEVGAGDPESCCIDLPPFDGVKL